MLTVIAQGGLNSSFPNHPPPCHTHLLNSPSPLSYSLTLVDYNRFYDNEILPDRAIGTARFRITSLCTRSFTFCSSPMPTHPRRRRRGAYSPRRRWPIATPGQAGQFTHIRTIPNYESDAFTDEQQDEEADEPTFRNPSYEATLAEQPTMDYHLNHNRDSPGADGSFAARARAGLRLSRSNSRELRDGERLPSVPVSLGGLMKFKAARRSNRSGRIVEHADLSGQHKPFRRESAFTRAQLTEPRHVK